MLLIACLVIGLPFASAQESTFVVVVHADNAVATLTADDISDMFLKKTTRWPTSRLPAQPVDQAPGAAVRESFSEAIHGRSVDRIKNYWQRRIFSGRDVPPPELSNDAAVVSFVSSNPGAIGYVSSGTELAGVKAVSVGG